MAAFQRALRRRPDDASLHNKLAWRSASSRASTRPKPPIVARSRSMRTSTRAGFNLAVVLAKQRRLAEAEDAYRAVIAREPAYRGVWLNLGNVLADQSQAR